MDISLINSVCNPREAGEMPKMILHHHIIFKAENSPDTLCTDDNGETVLNCLNELMKDITNEKLSQQNRTETTSQAFPIMTSRGHSPQNSNFHSLTHFLFARLK